MFQGLTRTYLPSERKVLLSIFDTCFTHQIIEKCLCRDLNCAATTLYLFHIYENKGLNISKNIAAYFHFLEKVGYCAGDEWTQQSQEIERIAPHLQFIKYYKNSIMRYFGSRLADSGGYR